MLHLKELTGDGEPIPLATDSTRHTENPNLEEIDWVIVDMSSYTSYINDTKEPLIPTRYNKNNSYNKTDK